MRIVTLPMLVVLQLISGIAESQENLDFVPSKYSCWDDYYWKTDGSIRIERSDDSYALIFGRRSRPGELRDYLAPIGVDPRIIASYQEWDIVSHIPANACIANTFASGNPEKLSCDANGVKFTIYAKYRISPNDPLVTDTYEFYRANIQLNAGSRKEYFGRHPAGVDVGYNFEFSYQFFGIGENYNRNFVVKSNRLFRAYHAQQTESGDLRLASLCGLSALGGLVSANIKDLVEDREND